MIEWKPHFLANFKPYSITSASLANGDLHKILKVWPSKVSPLWFLIIMAAADSEFELCQAMSVFTLTVPSFGGVHLCTWSEEFIILLSRHDPHLTHLIFANDTIIYAKASLQDAKRVSSILQCYEEASGQSISLSKSSIFFIPNTLEDVKHNISHMLHIHHINMRSKFFGLPLDISRSKRQIFYFLRERMATKTAGWKEHLLTKGGDEVLIKSVLTAISLYVISCFRLPLSL